MNYIHGIPVIPKIYILAGLRTALHFQQSKYIILDKNIIFENSSEALKEWEDYKLDRSYIASFIAKLFKMDKEHEECRRDIMTWMTANS